MTVAKLEVAKPTGLALLREPFPAHQISKLPKPYKKDSQKGNCRECGGYHGLPAAHLDYVGHAALTDRLLDTDPAWFWEPLAFDEHGLPAFDRTGGLWIRLTVCGVQRLGYGHAAPKSYGDPGMREKEVIGDALRNAAMRFGAALDLWHKGDLHLAEESEGEGQSGDSTVSPPPADVHTDDEPHGQYAFPEGPATGITQLKAMARELYRAVNSCETKAELDDLTLPELNADNAAIMKQMAALEHPGHREIWEGDGKDNPGLAGLITRKEYEFARQIADYATV